MPYDLKARIEAIGILHRDPQEQAEEVWSYLKEQEDPVAEAFAIMQLENLYDPTVFACAIVIRDYGDESSRKRLLYWIENEDVAVKLKSRALLALIVIDADEYTDHLVSIIQRAEGDFLRAAFKAARTHRVAETLPSLLDRGKKFLEAEDLESDYLQLIVSTILAIVQQWRLKEKRYQELIDFLGSCMWNGRQQTMVEDAVLTCLYIYKASNREIKPKVKRCLDNTVGFEFSGWVERWLWLSRLPIPGIKVFMTVWIVTLKGWPFSLIRLLQMLFGKNRQ